MLASAATVCCCARWRRCQAQSRSARSSSPLCGTRSSASSPRRRALSGPCKRQPRACRPDPQRVHRASLVSGEAPLGRWWLRLAGGAGAWRQPRGAGAGHLLCVVRPPLRLGHLPRHRRDVRDLCVDGPRVLPARLAPARRGWLRAPHLGRLPARLWRRGPHGGRRLRERRRRRRRRRQLAGCRGSCGVGLGGLRLPRPHHRPPAHPRRRGAQPGAHVLDGRPLRRPLRRRRRCRRRLGGDTPPDRARAAGAVGADGRRRLRQRLPLGVAPVRGHAHHLRRKVAALRRAAAALRRLVRRRAAERRGVSRHRCRRLADDRRCARGVRRRGGGGGRGERRGRQRRGRGGPGARRGARGFGLAAARRAARRDRGRDARRGGPPARAAARPARAEAAADGRGGGGVGGASDARSCTRQQAEGGVGILRRGGARRRDVLWR
mmetsp:Transcript_23002/g.67807  ORF Transcript_23002/g.67807 Transcript_23002/m.67807 type:complete len:436 (+) Transcript_23002:361-1668(+)